MKDVVLSVIGLLAGGGLGSLLSTRYVRKLKKEEARQKETESDVNEFNALRTIIDGLTEEVKFLQDRLHSQVEMSDALCKDCTYKQFYMKMEKRANEKINAKGAMAVGPYACPRGVVFPAKADEPSGGASPGAGS